MSAEPATASAGDARISARYQRLSLLHRMSLELFADKPFADALAEACRIALALTGARWVSVHFADAFGRPEAEHSAGEGAFAGPEAAAEEASVVAAAFSGLRLSSLDAGARLWHAAPLLRITPQAAVALGAVVFGRDRAPEDAAESETTLVEIARVLRDARLIQKSLQQQKTLAEIFARAADALLMTDLHARTLMWNPAAEELFQWTAAEMIGRDARVLVREGGMTEWRRLTVQLFRRGAKRGVEVVCRRKDGTPVPVEIAGSMLYDDDGAPYGALLAYRDITRRKQVERMKTEFVSLVSHELRTPLTAIRGFAETVAEEGESLTPEQRKQYLKVVLDESKRLTDMVTDFLDITRLESGAFERSDADVHAGALFAKVAGLFEGHPARPSFRTRVEPGAAVLRGDPDQLYRLLLNLVGNAVKYTPHGGTVELSSEPDGPGWAAVTVRDQGPGISKADQERLFEKFFRAGDDISRRTPGTGLGLAICKGIADAHGGRIWVESEPGKGAAFKALLPARA